MNPNQNDSRNENVTIPDASQLLDAAIDSGELPTVGNENALRGGTLDATPLSAVTGTLDTTPLAAAPDVVRCIRTTLGRHGVAQRDMADAIGDVQTDAIEVARTKRM